MKSVTPFGSRQFSPPAEHADWGGIGEPSNQSEMKEIHATYRQALRASGIDLSDRETALAFELAKAVNANIDMGLREWAQVHTKVNAEYPAKPVEHAKAERHYWAFSEIAAGEIHWPKAC